MSRTRAHSPGVEAAILNSGVARQKLGLWNSLCTTEPTLLEVIKWMSKVHYAHIQLDDEVTSNIVYWAMKSRTGSVDACNPQFQLQFSQSDIRAIISAPYLFGVVTPVVTFVLFAVATPNKYGDLLFESRMTSRRLWELTNHSQDLWHQVDLLRYRANHSIFYTSH